MKKLDEIKFSVLDEEMTLREYLKLLLSKLWKEGADFNSKRPWGNGSWQYDIYEVLIREGIVEGKLDEDGYVEQLDTEAADQIIIDYIEEVF